MSGAPRSGPLLAVDSGSPRVSVALGDAGGVLAVVQEPEARSSASLLGMIEAVLAEAGVGLDELGGALALRGPGSFTGLRVGLATVLGLHQALGLPATAVPTLEVLASLGAGESGTVVAAVDALRGEWFVQPFRGAPIPEPLGPPRLVATARLGEVGPFSRESTGLLVGHGVSALAEPLAAAGLETREPGPLAAAAVTLAGSRPPDWEPATLIEPLYLRPPAVTPAPAARRPPTGG